MFATAGAISLGLDLPKAAAGGPVQSQAGAITITPTGGPNGEAVYALTENQTLRLKLAQSQIYVAQLQFQKARENVEAKNNALFSEAEKIRAENNWPIGSGFNPDTLTFSAPPPKKEPDKK
jgi:hypothetical protein